MLVSSEEYVSLLADIRAAIIEGRFAAQWSVIECWHGVGKRIVEDPLYQRGNGAVLQGLANDLRISERTLYYAVQFYKLCPDLALLPGGKNMTWNRVVTNMLSSPGDGAKEPGPWTKTKYLYTVDLVGLPQFAVTQLETWREQTDELYNLIKKEKAKHENS